MPSEVSAGRIALELALNQEGFKTQLNRLNGIARRAGSSLASSLSSGTSQINRMTSSAKKLGVALGSAFAVYKLVNFTKQCVAAAQAQELAETKLSTVMRQRMKATDGMVNSIKKLTASQQELGVIGDEVQMAGAQQLATFLNSKKSLDTLIPAMNNLAAQQNGVNASAGDMVNIGNLMGKVMQGNTGALTRVGITFSEAEEQMIKYGNEEQRAATLAQVITNNVGNMNQALANTPYGAVAQLKNNFGDMMETLGKGIVNMIMPAIKWVNALIMRLQVLARLLASFTGSFMKLGSKSQKSAGDTIKNVTKAQTAAGSAAKMMGGNAAEAGDKISKSAKKAGNKTVKAAKDASKKLRSIMGFDQINKVTKNESAGGSGSSGSSGGPGSAGGVDPMSGLGNEGDFGLGDSLKVPEEKINKWAKKIFDCFKKKDWKGLGATIAQMMNKGMEKLYKAISWSRVGPKVNAFIHAFNQAFNEWVKKFDWALLGRIFGAGIMTLVNTLNLLLTGIDWNQLGRKVALSIQGLFSEINWSAIGQYFANKINALWGFLHGLVSAMPYKKIGLSFAQGVNGFFGTVDFVTIGKALYKGINGAFQTMATFTKKVNWKAISKKISAGVNTFIRGVDWAKNGKILSNFVLKMLGTIQDTAKKINWQKLGKGIGDFLGNIEWGTIFKKVVSTMATVFGGLLKGFAGSSGLKVGLAAIGLKLGPALLGVLGTGLKFIGKEKIKAMLKSGFTGKISEALLGQVTGGGGLLSLIKSVFGKIPALLSKINIAGVLGKIGTAFKALGAVIMAHPIVAICAAIAAAAFLIYKNWDKVKKTKFGKMLIAVGQALKKVGAYLVGTFVKAIKTAKKVFDTVVSSVTNLPKTIKETFKNKIQGAKEWFSGIKDGFDKAVGDLADNLPDLSGLKDKVQESLSNIDAKIDAAISLVKKGWTTLTDFVGNAVSATISLAKKGWTTISSFVGDTVSAAVSLIKNGWSTLSGFVGSAVTAAVSLIKSGWSKLSDFVGDTVSAAVSLAKSGWKTVSDWVEDKLGGAVSKAIGLAKSGWSNVADWVHDRLGGGINKAIGLAKSGWSNVASWVEKSFGKGLAKLIGLKKSGWSNVAQWVKKSFGKGVWKLIGLKKSGWSTVQAWVKKYIGGTISVGVSLFKKAGGSLWNMISKKASGGIYKGGRWYPVQSYGSGGSPGQGQVFVAREAGPELVGSLGGHTAVMNNNQIVASVASGVSKAVSAVMGNFGQKIYSAISNITFRATSGLANERAPRLDMARVTTRAEETGQISEMLNILRMLQAGGSSAETLALLRQVVTLLNMIMANPIYLDGDDIRKNVVNRVNRNTRATGKCEIIF